MALVILELSLGTCRTAEEIAVACREDHVQAEYLQNNPIVSSNSRGLPQVALD